METSRVTLKPAMKCDIPGLLEMIKEYHEYDHLDFDPIKIENLIEQMISNEALGRLWLVLAAGECAGYAMITFGFSFEYLGRDAFLDELFLKEKFRGKGVGKEALSEIQNQSASMGVVAIHLEIVKKNTGALKLYERAGFVDHDRFLMTWWKEN